MVVGRTPSGFARRARSLSDGRCHPEDRAEATGETAKQAEKEWQGVTRSQDAAHTLTAGPAINVKPVVGGVEIAVRYITRANDRYQMRAKLNQAAVNLLGQGFVAPHAAAPESAPKQA